MTRAMILAAGLGSRLGTLSDERPKPLLPVADIPLIRYAMALLAGHGIRDVVVNLHHRGDLIRAELGDEVRYSPEDRLLGTGGGIRRALPLLGDEPFVVMNGKVVFELDLADLLRRHRESGADATLVVRPDPDAAKWGALEIEGGRVKQFFSPAGRHMFTGVHVINPSLVARLADDDSERCIIRQGYTRWNDAKIGAYEAAGYFMEHSTPERYLAGNVNVLRGAAKLTHPPGALTGVDEHARVAGTVVAPVRIGPGAVVERGAVVGPDTVIGRGARVAAGARVERSVIWPGAVVASGATGEIVTPTQRLRVGT